MDHFLVALFGAGGAATVWALFKGSAYLMQTAGMLKLKTQRGIAEEYQQIVNMLQVQADRVVEDRDGLARELEAAHAKMRKLEREHDRCQNEQRAMREAMRKAGIPVGGGEDDEP